MFCFPVRVSFLGTFFFLKTKTVLLFSMVASCGLVHLSIKKLLFLLITEVNRVVPQGPQSSMLAQMATRVSKPDPYWDRNSL